jgi:hypothetical protein
MLTGLEQALIVHGLDYRKLFFVPKTVKHLCLPKTLSDLGKV